MTPAPPSSSLEISQLGCTCLRVPELHEQGCPQDSDMNPLGINAPGCCSLSCLAPAESTTSTSSLRGLCFLLGVGWLSAGETSAGRGWPSQSWGDCARGEEATRGSSVRLALNLQKSAYLEQCSIHLLISPLALISLLVLLPQCCFRGGREGGNGRGGGREPRTRLRRRCSNFPRPTLPCPAGLRALHPSEGDRVSSGLGPWLRGCFQGRRVEEQSKNLLSPAQLPSCQSLLRHLKLGVHPMPRAEAKSQRREREMWSLSWLGAH